MNALTDRQAWLFSIKTYLAAVAALYIAMAGNLSRPYWAMGTVYIVSQPLLGPTRAKGVYRIVGTLGLDERWPQVFMATASCAEAKVKLMGLPYEAWSGMLFGAIGLYAPWRVAFSFAKARRR